MNRSKKADKWIPFIERMLNGLSLRKTAFKIAITHVTAFTEGTKCCLLSPKKVSVFLKD